MLLEAINIHPVKSTAIRPLTEAQVLPRGLVDDRSWMVVDGDGRLVSARELRSLFHVAADTPVTAPGLGVPLRLSADGASPLDVHVPTGARVPIRLHRNDLSGVPAAEAAHVWLRKFTGRDDLRLIWCDDPTRRALNPEHSRAGDHTAFADGYPVTLASLASLRQLNEWIAQTRRAAGEEPTEPLAMQRFRPNLVIDGDEPFAEDHWHQVGVGEVVFRVAEPVGRCVMTTIDPDSLAGGKEPIRTLARHRRSAKDTLFAIHLIPERTGRIAVGDEVRPLAN